MAVAAFVTVYSARWGPIEELGIGYIAAHLEKSGHQADVAYVSDDLTSGMPLLEKVLATCHPLLLGIGCSHRTLDFDRLRQLTTHIRSIAPEIHITCGGYWATFNYGQLLAEWPDLDSVVVGEGEETTLDLLTRLATNISLNHCPGLALRLGTPPTRQVIHNLDSLALPKRSLPDNMQHGIASISTSRGCLAHCTFCNVPKWMSRYGGGTWRGRSPIHVVDEFEELIRGRGIRRFWVVDSSYEDPFPAGISRILEIADEILKRRLRLTYYVFFRAETVASPAFQEAISKLVSSGLRRVFIGVESADEDDLRSFIKKARPSEMARAISVLRTSKLAVRAGFILFSPRSTFESLRSTVAFMQENDLLWSTTDLTTCLELYSGAAEVTRLAKEGLLTGDPWRDPYCYRFRDQRLQPLAKALRDIRAENRVAHRWESVHTAYLVCNGAAHCEAIFDRPAVVTDLERFEREINDIAEFLSGQNAVFFENLLELTEGQWDQSRFDELAREFIDTYQTEAAATAEVLTHEFLLKCQADGVDLLF